MRRLAIAVGAMATAGLFVLAAATPAAAAQGVLFLNDREYVDPTGCINNPAPGPTHVLNHTDAPVYVYVEPNCQGVPPRVVHPGDADFVMTGSVMPQW